MNGESGQWRKQVKLEKQSANYFDLHRSEIRQNLG